MSRDSEDDELEPSAGGPDLQELLVWSVARSRWWVLGLVLAGAMGGLLAGIVQPNTYASHAKLLLRIGERERMTSETLIGGAQTLDSRPNIETEMHLLRDRRNFERAVRELGPDWILAPADPTRWDDERTPPYVRWLHWLQAQFWRAGARGEGSLDSSPEEIFREATRVLVQDTELSVEYGSNVISVVHVSTSPEKAQRITEALVESFIQRHQEQFSALPLLEANRDKLSAQQNRWEEARRRFSLHVEECLLFDLNEQGPTILAEQADLRQQLFRARTDREVLAEQLSELQERLADTPERVEVAIYGEPVANPAFVDLTEQRRSAVQQRAELARMALSAAERERRRTELDQRIAALDATIAETPPTIATGGDLRELRDNPLRVELKSRIAELRFEERGTLTRIDQLLRGLAAVDEQVQTLRTCTDLHQILEMQINRELQSYQELSSQFARVEALARLERGGDSNLSELQLPTLPVDKEGPRRFRLLAFGLLLGGALGLALAVARHLLDPHLRYPQSVERLLGVRLIGVLPETRALRHFEGSAGQGRPGAGPRP